MSSGKKWAGGYIHIMNVFVPAEQKNLCIISLYNQGKLKAADVYRKKRQENWEELTGWQNLNFIESGQRWKRGATILTVRVLRIMVLDE